MSFGYRDEDWVDPPEPQSFRVTCRDCENCNLCQCGRHGFCTELMEFIDPDESLLVWEECEYFKPNNRDCFEREAGIWIDTECDRMRDLALERE